MLWFDVEEKGNTTCCKGFPILEQLWFDVEEKGNTTIGKAIQIDWELWFDVEEKGNTTRMPLLPRSIGCGLM